MVNVKVVPLRQWEVFEFPWGAAVRERRTKRWIKLFLKPDGQEVDVNEREVDLHENGIEFLQGQSKAKKRKGKGEQSEHE